MLSKKKPNSNPCISFWISNCSGMPNNTFKKEESVYHVKFYFSLLQQALCEQFEIETTVVWLRDTMEMQILYRDQQEPIETVIKNMS